MIKRIKFAFVRSIRQIRVQKFSKKLSEKNKIRQRLNRFGLISYFEIL